MGPANRLGQTEPAMRVAGRTIEHLAKANLFILTAMFTKVTG
jgi:hypothetical protein